VSIGPIHQHGPIHIPVRRGARFRSYTDVASGAASLVTEAELNRSGGFRSRLSRGHESGRITGHATSRRIGVRCLRASVQQKGAA